MLQDHLGLSVDELTIQRDPLILTVTAKFGFGHDSSEPAGLPLIQGHQGSGRKSSVDGTNPHR